MLRINLHAHMYNIQLKHLYYINSQTKYLIKNRRHTDKQDVDLTRHRSIEMSNKDFLRNKIHWYGFRTQVGIPVIVGLKYYLAWAEVFIRTGIISLGY